MKRLLLLLPILLLPACGGGPRDTPDLPPAPSPAPPPPAQLGSPITSSKLNIEMPRGVTVFENGAGQTCTLAVTPVYAGSGVALSCVNTNLN